LPPCYTTAPIGGLLRGVEELVDDAFEDFLFSGAQCGCWSVEGDCVELREGGFAGFDLFAEVRVPARVAFADCIREPSIGADGGGHFQPDCEGIHPNDMRMEEVQRLERVSAAFGIEVQSAGGKSAHGQDLQHDAGGEIQIGWEFIGIPSAIGSSLVGVHGAECAGFARDAHFVNHGVTGECGVIGFQIEFEMFEQVEFAQEVQARGCVGVVLVCRWFLRFGFDVELALKSNALFIIHGHVEEGPEVIAFPLEVGVDDGAVPFASAPERVALAAQRVGYIHGLLHLRSGMRVNAEVRRCGSTLRVARMREQAGRAPEELASGLGLLFLQAGSDLVKDLLGFANRIPLGRDITVVETIVLNPDLCEEFKKYVDPLQRIFGGLGAIIPRHERGPCAKWISERIAHAMPVGRSKPEVVRHGFPLDQLSCVVLLEGEWVFGETALERDGCGGEVVGHREDLWSFWGLG